MSYKVLRKPLKQKEYLNSEGEVSAMQIGENSISAQNAVFIIAEIGVNHNGSVELAKSLIDAAVDAGADAVKFQLFQSIELASPLARLAKYQEKTATKNQLELLKQYELQPTEWGSLQQYCLDKGIPILFTPFDLESVKLLKQFDSDAIKIGSGDITNFPLLRAVAELNKPVILSTGMCGLSEIEKALQEINWQNDVALLHCTSQYPAPFNALNLRVIETLSAAFGRVVGYSDHTPGIEVPIAVTALGYRIIEKHLTLDKNLPGPDHAASIEPMMFKQMVQGIRHIEEALGSTEKRCTPAELETRAKVRRGIYARREIEQGSVIELGDLSFLRPVVAVGIEACYDQQVVGRTAQSTIKAGEPLQWGHIFQVSGCDQA